jgi:hypothetical protein
VCSGAVVALMLERYEVDVGGTLQPPPDGPSLSQGAAFGAFTQALPSAVMETLYMLA